MSIEIRHCLLAPSGSCVIDGPVGRWWLEWCDQGLLAVRNTDVRPRGRLPQWLERPWEAFWSGQDYDLTLCTPKRLGPFFFKVYQQLSQVLRQGETRSFGEIAALCGSPRAAQMVAQAVRDNPWPLFLPCHRVIGSGEKLSEYFNRRHRELKAQLLEYEQKMRDLGDSLGSRVETALDWLRS